MISALNKQRIVLDFNVESAKYEIRGNGALALELETTKPEVHMETTKPKVQIDQSECFAECGLKSPSRMLQDTVAYSRQMVMKGVERIVSQGNQMLDIHEGTDVVAENAEYNAFGMFHEHEFNYDVIPKSRPNITIVKGEINYNVIRGKVENLTKPKPLDITYTPGKVSFFTK